MEPPASIYLIYLSISMPSGTLDILLVTQSINIAAILRFVIMCNDNVCTCSMYEVWVFVLSVLIGGCSAHTTCIQCPC